MTTSYQAFGLLLAQVWGNEVDLRVLRPAGGGTSGLRLGADRQGYRHILAPIDESRGFQEQVWETLRLEEWSNNGQRYLDLVCTSDSLSHVFASLADDVTRRVDEAGEEPAQALQQTLSEWRRLLKAAHSVSEEEARGLFGELTVLGLLAAQDPHYALDCWTGPEGSVHDFTTKRGDLEVKTSGSEGLDVVISSLRQLDREGNRDLALVRLHVASDPQGQNLSDLVETLTSAGILRDEIVSKLARAGFLVGADPDAHRFQIKSSPVAWLVDDSFPGLRSGDIPSGRQNAITRVSYTLDLVAAGESMSENQWGNYLNQMMMS